MEIWRRTVEREMRRRGWKWVQLDQQATEINGVPCSYAGAWRHEKEELTTSKLNSVRSLRDILNLNGTAVRDVKNQVKHERQAVTLVKDIFHSVSHLPRI